MNILTKICIVVVALASMVAAPVFINMATVPENFKDLFQRQKAHYGLLKATSKAASEENKRLRERLKEKAKTSAASESGLQVTIDKLNGENASLRLQLTKDEARVAGIRDELTGLNLTLDAQSKRIKALQEQKDKSWKEQNRLQATTIQLSNNLKEVKAANARLEKSIKVHRRNLHDAQATIIELNRKLTELQAGGATASAEDKTPPAPAKAVSGSVTAASGVIVSVNIGSAHGLKKGMELTVYRGSNYVGTMRVEQVEVGEAVGTLIVKILAPRAGDKVASDLSK